MTDTQFGSASPETQACECKALVPPHRLPWHRKSTAHLRWMEQEIARLRGQETAPAPAPVEPDGPLPEPLAAAVDMSKRLTPQERAKTVRRYFASEGWEPPAWGPYGSPEHFLKAHNIPIAPLVRPLVVAAPWKGDERYAKEP